VSAGPALQIADGDDADLMAKGPLAAKRNALLLTRVDSQLPRPFSGWAEMSIKSRGIFRHTNCTFHSRLVNTGKTLQKEEKSMYKFCFTINGQRHCFAIPALIQIIHRPGPINYPPFEIAIAVEELVKLAPASEFTRQLGALAHDFIASVKKGLPAGVELVAAKESQAAR
jgi:hypothetical protein